MKKIEDFRFALNVSAEGYEKKTDASACLSSAGAKAIKRKKMCFFEMNLTVNEFIEKAFEGHSFCALFRFKENKKYWYENRLGRKYLAYPHYTKDTITSTKGGLKIDFKRDEYFSGAQVIFIDIDNTKYTNLEEYIEKLTFKPTMVYMSYSDGKEKNGVISRRFHLCYIFDKILNKDEFKEASELLSTQLVQDTGEELEDKCGQNISQYMNGCFGNKENYKTFIIYNLNDVRECHTDTLTSIPLTINCQNHTTLDERGESGMEEVVEEEIDFDETLLFDLNNLSYDEVMKFNRWKYQYIWRVDNGNWIESDNFFYQKTDENYFALYFNVFKVKDGHERRKKLYQRMCLRRVINPEVDANTLLFDAYCDLNRFFENDKDVVQNVITIDDLVKNVKSAMGKTLEEIKEEYSDLIDYLKSRSKKKVIYKFKNFHEGIKDNQKLLKLNVWSVIKKNYDTTKSVEENLEYLNSIGLSISYRTLYRFLNENGMKTDSTKLTDSEIVNLIDFNQSANYNYKKIKDAGHKIDRNRLLRIYKENKTYITTSNNNVWEKVETKEEVNIFDNWNYGENSWFNPEVFKKAQEEKKEEVKEEPITFEIPKNDNDWNDWLTLWNNSLKIEDEGEPVESSTEKSSEMSFTIEVPEFLKAV